MLARVATLKLPDPVVAAFVGGITGADISPDGRRLVLCDYFRAYEVVVPARGGFDAPDVTGYTHTEVRRHRR